MSYRSSSQESSKTTCLLFVIYLLCLIPGSIWSGYVLSVLWAWFIVPTFELQAISIPAAIGVSLLVNYLTSKSPQANEGNQSGQSKIAQTFINGLVFMFFSPLFALGMGAVVRMFM